MTSIDLNSDLGESFGVWKLGDDEAMLELVTSANVACGFHAGDPSTLRAVCTAAVHNHVSIGAQVSYPDLLGFGRRYIDIDPRDLRDAVLYQLGALDAFAQVAGAEVGLRQAARRPVPRDDRRRGTGRCRGRRRQPSTTRRSPCSVRPARRCCAAADAAGLEPVPEAFADRAYLRDGRLVPRSEPDALLIEPAEVAARAVRLATEHEVVSVDGSVVRGRGALDLRPRRHARRRRAGPRGPRRARRGGRRRATLHRVTPRLLP